MNKKIGFWHWLILSPIRIAKWILGIGKEKMNDNIVNRTGVVGVIYEILAGVVVINWLVWSGNIYDTAFVVKTVFGVCMVPPILTLVVIILYQTYLEDMKDAK